MDLEEIIKAIGGKPVNFKNTDIKGISIDSRTIKSGELFVAIKGERFDGHDFVEEAFKKGAVAAIVEDKIRNTQYVPRLRSGQAIRNTKRLIKVRDTLKALGDIAHHHRTKFNVPLIAVTGSTGKTTVKEIVSHILSRKYNVLKNDGTKNNLIGLPLALLNLSEQHDISVLEMGANHLGEIKRLSEIAKPTIGIITNIGPSHLEFFKNTYNVFKAKSELLNSLGLNSLALLNSDDKYLSKAKTECKKVYFGIYSDCKFRATHIERNGNSIKFKVKDSYYKIALFGRHNVYNALASIAIGQIFGIKQSIISRALRNFRNPFSNRLTLYKNNYLEILNDTYNSNPLSFEKAIESLVSLGPKKRKVIVSADMLELGDKSKYFHTKIGKYIAQTGIDVLITSGPMSRYTSESALKHGMNSDNVIHFNAREDLIKTLPSVLQREDTVLVKGSRAMHMEKVVEAINRMSSMHVKKRGMRDEGRETNSSIIRHPSSIVTES